MQYVRENLHPEIHVAVFYSFYDSLKFFGLFSYNTDSILKCSVHGEWKIAMCVEGGSGGLGEIISRNLPGGFQKSNADLVTAGNVPGDNQTGYFQNTLRHACF
jgi:hypothetical protein